MYVAGMPARARQSASVSSITRSNGPAAVAVLEDADAGAGEVPEVALCLRSTGSGSTAGPAEKLKMRWLMVDASSRLQRAERQGR